MAHNNQETSASENLSALDLLKQLQTDLGDGQTDRPEGAKTKRQAVLEKMAGEISAYITDDMDDAAMAQIIRKYLNGELAAKGENAFAPESAEAEPVEAERIEAEPVEAEPIKAEPAAEYEPAKAPAPEPATAEEPQGFTAAPQEQTEQTPVGGKDDAEDDTGYGDAPAQPRQTQAEAENGQAADEPKTAESTTPEESEVYLEEEVADYPQAILDIAAEQEKAAQQRAREQAEQAEKEQAELRAKQAAEEYEAQKAAKERAERAAGALGLDELIAEQESEGDRSYEEFMEFLAQRGEDAEHPEEEKAEEPLAFISPEEKQAQDHAASEQIADGDTAAMEDSLTASMTEDLERSAGEFDQQDLELMMAFGEDGKLNEEVGQQRAQELREEIARRREDTYDRMVRAKGEKSRLAARTEYVSAAQNKEIFAGYKKRYGKTLLKVVLGVVLLVLLFLYENAFWIGMKLPQALDSTAYPVIHTLINYQLTLLLCGLVWKQLWQGLRAAFHKQPVADTVTALGLIFATVYSAAICILSPAAGVRLYNFPVGLCAFLNLLHELLRQKREIMAFKVVSSKKTKYAADPLPREEAEQEIETFSEYLPDSPAMFRIRRTSFVEGFYERFDAYPAYKKVLRVVFPLMLLACVAFGAASYLMKQDVYTAVNMGYVAAMAVLPVSAFVSFGMPVYEAAARAFAKDSAILGDGSFAEYSDASVISFTDADVFPAWGVKVRSVKVYGENRIDHILYNAASVFSRIGGPLADVFSMATAELGHSDVTEIRRIDDDGIEATVDGRLILIGKASFMNRYGYSIHLRDEEQTMENSYDASVLFMAYETEMAAKMFVQYSVDSDFETVLKELYRQGVCVAIKTSDPNIDDGMLAAKIHMSRYPVKTIRRRREDPTASESVERLGSGVVSKGSAKSLLQALALCEKVLRCIRRNTVLKICAILIGLAVLTLLIFFGQSFTLPSAAIALYHLLFMLPMLLFAKLGVK